MGVPVRRAIELLNILRSYVDNRNFDNGYIQALNEYLKVVPTPLGMQIDPYKVYQSVADVDHQRNILSSLLTSNPVTVQQNTEEVNPENRTISLKAISKSFWRHL